jgi:hypothetical protein
MPQSDAIGNCQFGREGSFRALMADNVGHWMEKHVTLTLMLAHTFS